MNNHISLYDERVALKALPEILPHSDKGNEASRAVDQRTGTDDLPTATVGKTVAKTVKKTAQKLPQTAYLAGQAMSEQVNKKDPSPGGDTSFSQTHKPIKKGDLGNTKLPKSMLVTAKNGEGGIRTRGRGVYPYDGLANRCLKPLGHLSE